MVEPKAPYDTPKLAYGALIGPGFDTPVEHFVELPPNTL
jgi:hypothetical protein